LSVISVRGNGVAGVVVVVVVAIVGVAVAGVVCGVVSFVVGDVGRVNVVVGVVFTWIAIYVCTDVVVVRCCLCRLVLSASLIAFMSLLLLMFVVVVVLLLLRLFEYVAVRINSTCVVVDVVVHSVGVVLVVVVDYDGECCCYVVGCMYAFGYVGYVDGWDGNERGVL